MSRDAAIGGLQSSGCFSEMLRAMSKWVVGEVKIEVAGEKLDALVK